YLALSYVWGGDQTHKTTTSNISTYEQGIAPALLPATIRDAIYVTHMLGFRWLWVDSLCIIQDSDDDKRHEIGRMHHIYRYAHLTIIAASAEHVSEGFLQERPPPPGMDFGNYKTVRLTPAYSSQSRWPSTADLGRMGTRAWCMQEYLMSPRSLIFHPQSLYFRCLTATQSVGDSFCSTYEERRIPITLFLDPLVAAPGSMEWIEVYRAWMAIVEDYSGRAASVESDKLIACAAVAEQFYAVLGSEYLAGLWRSDKLLADLLWDARMGAQGRRHTRPTGYRAPSWSWAAIEGPVRWNFPTWEDDWVVALAEIVECRVTLEDAALPFGQVTGGALVLR
ncbi:HET-domain-containing protein, partial [Trametes versicolor FP-101664 SS1]|uniref:HET-domain-containing protein n=1 Tax=Trametes versicolor (strain FP-101664) TaxID=717944 RepID=UPI0004621FF7